MRQPVREAARLLERARARSERRSLEALQSTSPRMFARARRAQMSVDRRRDRLSVWCALETLHDMLVDPKRDRQDVYVARFQMFGDLVGVHVVRSNSGGAAR